MRAIKTRYCRKLFNLPSNIIRGWLGWWQQLMSCSVELKFIPHKQVVHNFCTISLGGAKQAERCSVHTFGYAD